MSPTKSAGWDSRSAPLHASPICWRYVSDKENSMRFALCLLTLFLSANLLADNQLEPGDTLLCERVAVKIPPGEALKTATLLEILSPRLISVCNIGDNSIHQSELSIFWEFAGGERSKILGNGQCLPVTESKFLKYQVVKPASALGKHSYKNIKWCIEKKSR